MIPLKLQIKNFLSYGADLQTIDFEPYHMICLSGKNGHGKSALLDAMTWSIWGQARKITGVAKADEGLLRLGQSQMMVQLTFICNGQTYQVRREYNKSSYGKAYVNLDFGIFDTEKQNFVPVCGKSVRSAQAAIEEVVHLDFDSFCNSAFLRQGQSNEFSKKSAKERKEVLGAILGLGQYEAIRKLASDKAREATNERIAVTAVLERAKQELQQVATIELAMHTVTQQLAEVASDEAKLLDERREVACEQTACTHEQQQLQLLRARAEELSAHEKQLRQSLRAIVTQWRSVHAQQLQVAAQSSGENDRRELLNELNKQQEHMQEGLAFKERLLEAQRKLHEREQVIMNAGAQQLQAQKVAVERAMLELHGLIEKVNTLEASKESLEREQRQLMAEVSTLQKTMQSSAGTCKDINRTQQQFEKRKAFYQQMITEGNMLQHEIENLAHKQSLSQDEANPSCPLCEQNLSVARRRFLKSKFAKDEQFMRHRFVRITRIVQRLKLLLIEQYEQLTKMQQAAQTQSTATTQYEQCEKRLAQIVTDIQTISVHYQEAIHAVAQGKERIKTEQEKVHSCSQSINTQMQRDEQWQALCSTIATIEQSLLTHHADATIVTDIRARLAAIEQQMNSYQELIKQSALQEQRMQETVALAQQIKKCKQEHAALVQQQEERKGIVARQDALALHIQTVEKLSQEVAARKEILLQEKGSLENQRKKLQDLDAEFTIHQKKLQEIEERLDDMQAIVAATGKDGIQALLIQDVLPEIEQEANQLIAKLTDNQSQIFIESLRDLKKGGTKETLDINISDGLGIRPYEMFSGGEAFRIDFALRIAMSKLLARRAGTSLQTLIIDEGFGSQDEDGLACIMDALYKIQDDFAKVIIVSHLPSMKDSFPVHFYVEKKPTGSIVNVMEQG